MSLTTAQADAVAARGNVLVVAGAGTGKTRTLVERCVRCLLDESPPVSLEEMLVVTFTEAAAAEMRARIRARLEEKLVEQPRNGWLQEQLALFDTAHIGTLHSFCLQLVRQHFYELELDPQLTVLPEEEARLQADETLNEILQAHYAGETESGEAVQQLIQTQARGWDVPVRDLVLRLHHYTQTLRDPEGWFARQLQMFESVEPVEWQGWLLGGVRDWRDRWLPLLQTLGGENKKAAECAGILENLPEQPAREECAAVLERVGIADLNENWPKGKKTAWRGPLENFFDEAIFFKSLAKTKGTTDPLVEDWNWMRRHMITLLRLAREFTAKYSDKKRELGVVDFHDLEQHALRLLWNNATQQPTPIAQQWREQLRFVFVDEYQDINDAQDAILKALGREGAAANRFLVGDVKQSIYRFRLADPRIFQNYVDTLGRGEGRMVALVDNFRSREPLLNFINPLFTGLMRREMGGVPYDDLARLRFGDPEGRAALGVAKQTGPCVELHLRLKGTEGTAAEGDAETTSAEVLNLEEAGKEARLIALRLRELKASGQPVWDEALRQMRPVEWRDMAVLLRSPAGKAECFAREFSRLGVPLIVTRGGFYGSLEVADLLNLLQLLDNPRQDLPALAVLHSPLVGMTVDELAAVRLAFPSGPIWTALQKYHETGADSPGKGKAARFLKNFKAWRRLARQVSLSRCLESVLAETHYADWLLTQPRGEQRQANVNRLLALARQFDRFQRQGLFWFLRFIEAQQEGEREPDVAVVSGEDSVSLMSVHQSKGLEFPVAVAADLHKQFNLSDLRAEIILDEEFGLCPQIKPPHAGQRYPSLPYHLARQRQTGESLGEELRLLYVALTRARDLLILSGAISEKKFNARWRGEGDLSTETLLGARNYLDWLGAWSAEALGAFPMATQGENSFWHWTLYEDLDARLADRPEIVAEPMTTPADGNLNAGALKKLRERLAWTYPHAAATREAAKTSVTAVRRRIADEADAEAATVFKFQAVRERQAAAGGKKMAATDVGNAHHLFLQRMTLEHSGSVGELRAEARHLEEQGVLSPEAVAELDFEALAAFWRSDLGSSIRTQAAQVRRELEFTARFGLKELRQFGAEIADAPGDEFVVVQGAADLAVLLPEEIWIVDFKTDRMGEADLPAKTKLYEPQLRLYALALGRIYRRSVTQAHLHFLALRRSVAVDCAVKKIQQQTT